MCHISEVTCLRLNLYVRVVTTTALTPYRIFTEPQQGATYDDLLAVALRAESLGFGAFFRSDHYLKMGSVSGDPGPSDAWVTLGGLARDTTTIRLGTLVTAATFRHPGPLAISVANVDQMSGGRVELGLGAGWYEAEHSAYGIPFPALGSDSIALPSNSQLSMGCGKPPKVKHFHTAVITGHSPTRRLFPSLCNRGAYRSSSAVAVRRELQH